MPIECSYLSDAPYPEVKCPHCGDFPLEPFMRGQVQRRRYKIDVEWRSFTIWRLVFKYPLIRSKERPYCAIICRNCKNIVGYEAPSQEDIDRYNNAQSAASGPDVFYVDPDGKARVQDAAKSSMASNIASSSFDYYQAHPPGCMCWGCQKGHIDSGM